jgi:hypothetical protein
LIKYSHNANVYNASEKLIPLCDDVYKILNSLVDNKCVNASISDIPLSSSIDIILLSPPWGGNIHLYICNCLHLLLFNNISIIKIFNRTKLFRCCNV